MKLETFFEKFDTFADAPDAVAKMRELVLELAVRGRLLSSGNLDSSAHSDPSTAFPIPHDWRWIALNKAADCRAAAKVDSASLNDSDWVLDLEDIDGGAGKVVATVTFAERRSLSTKASFQKGDVLYGKLRPYLNKVVIADRPGFCTTEIIPLRPQTFVAAGYLRLFLRSPHFLRYAAAKSYGMKMPRLGTQDLESAAISLPPLAEQKRIVAKVDELMAICDRLEEQQKEREEQGAHLARAALARFAEAPTPADLEILFHSSFSIPPSDLRKSILTLAVQGKLVPQDPEDEPAEELFERIQAERAEQEAKGAYKSSRPLEQIEESEEPFKLPVEWKWVRLRSIVFTLGDGLHGTPEYLDGTDCYFINGNNLIDGQIVIKPHTKTVSLDEAKKHRKPMTLSTVLVSINGTLGSVAFYNNENVILGKSACYFNLATLVDKYFARRVIESPYFVNYAFENATGTTIRNLGLKAMNYLPFPLPPLAEQRRIVAKVEQLMALVDALEAQLAAARATAASLLEAAVAELTTPRLPKCCHDI